MPKKSYNQVLDEHLHILIAQGSYEAFIKLRKRYHLHSASLVHDILKQYGYTGVTFRELMSICDEFFLFVILKYTHGESSFYFYWKNATTQQLIEYLVERSEEDGYFDFKSIVSFDQKNDESHTYSELIAEKSEDKVAKRKIFEIKHILHKYDVFFTLAEKTLLNLILEGYTLKDFEHVGMLRKSQINLTYKSAIEKVQKYLESDN